MKLGAADRSCNERPAGSSNLQVATSPLVERQEAAANWLQLTGNCFQHPRPNDMD